MSSHDCDGDDRRPDEAGAPERIDPTGGPDAAAERRDSMAPPPEPCECYCLHCGRTFMSDRMWFQRVKGDPKGFDGFWLCPTPNCSGAGFTFDIFPTDPNHPANAGWHYVDEDEGGDWDDNADEGADEHAEWDPDEPQYQELEELEEDDEDDLDGEEWKFGLQPGERPEAGWEQEARQQWEEEQLQYDQPDRRPRELDWTGREDREPAPGEEDDIPF